MLMRISLVLPLPSPHYQHKKRHRSVSQSESENLDTIECDICDCQLLCSSHHTLLGDPHCSTCTLPFFYSPVGLQSPTVPGQAETCSSSLKPLMNRMPLAARLNIAPCLLLLHFFLHLRFSYSFQDLPTIFTLALEVCMYKSLTVLCSIHFMTRPWFKFWLRLN